MEIWEFATQEGAKKNNFLICPSEYCVLEIEGCVISGEGGVEWEERVSVAYNNAIDIQLTNLLCLSLVYCYSFSI